MMETYNDQILSQVRYITSIIDTVAIMKKHTIPSTNPQKPIVLTDSISVFSSTVNIATEQDSSNLVIKAIVGDNVSFISESGCTRTSAHVIIYNVRHIAKNKVLSPLRFNNYKDVFLSPIQDNSFSVSAVLPERFWFYDAGFSETGSEEYAINFAIYFESDNHTFDLFGYFEWRTHI